MLFIVTLIELISCFVSSANYNIIRQKLFYLSAILSLFFFSSYDPIIGMPLYVYPMICSITISFLYNPKIDKQLFLCFFFLILSLMIPLIEIVLKINSGSYLLLKESTTDTLLINSQFHTPTVNFVVIKHFLFMIAYVLFVIVNIDIVKDNDFIKSMLFRIVSLFKILFVGIIVEWIVVNLMGGINDRYLMGSLFSLKTINQTENWKTWGSYSVALCFAERSNFNIVAIFYMMYLKKKDMIFMDWIWIVISSIAIYCTGSSSCLAILVLYLVTEIFIVIMRNRKISQFMFILLIIIGCAIVLFNNFELFTSKLEAFFSNEESWSSGYFRANSIIYGIKAIKDHIFFGVGIGTVYVHSMFVQTLANIGMVGTFLVLWIHYKLCPIKNNLVNSLTVFFYNQY